MRGFGLEPCGGASPTVAGAVQQSMKQRSRRDGDFIWELIFSLLDACLFELAGCLPVAFRVAETAPEEIAEWDAESANRRGFIPFITDFSEIVQFGYAGDGAAYCFDYRENPDEPSIIHWNEAYWRRVAPHFQYFLD